MLVAVAAALFLKYRLCMCNINLNAGSCGGCFVPEISPVHVQH
jgi:hypothetical protein